MLTNKFAEKFAEKWVAAWNAHDIDRILNHYTDDFIIESPLALKRFPESGGVLKGKQKIKAYWTIGLQNPLLHFEIIEVLVGINSLTIYYWSKSANRKVAELLLFNAEHKVYRAIVNYGNNDTKRFNPETN